MQADSVVVRAPAKVNLHLEVLAKRADGYHEIETLMLAVSLHDTLEIKEERSGKLLLSCNHPELSTGPENLVYRAADLLRRRGGHVRGASIVLHKNIPLAAGLAGGSTDAAAALFGLNRLWGLGKSDAELAELGAELGSDVPFFFATPAAWCTGRGERVTPVLISATLDLVLVSPEEGLSTAAVYRSVTVPESPESGDAIRRALQEGNVEELGRRLHNRLQPAAEALCPRLAEIRQRLERLRPAGCLMSGSGSSLFALCRDQGEAEKIAHELRHGTAAEANPRVWVVSSCS